MGMAIEYDEPDGRAEFYRMREYIWQLELANGKLRKSQDTLRVAMDEVLGYMSEGGMGAYEQSQMLLSALKAVEWVPIVDIWDENVIGCACCGATKEWGKHHPKCNVGTAIAAVEGV